MAKLGYTWYPKDWGNSEKVFELTLIERGLYRELIDMAMLCDNKIQTNSKTWARKFGSTETEIEWILSTLEELKLIEFKKDILFIPSCENRLNLVRGGSKGGKTSKPTSKPFGSLSEKTIKPTSKQREIETKTEIEIEIENNINSFFIEFENGSHILEIARINKFTIEAVKLKLIDFRKFAELEYPNYGKFVSHFKNWILKNPPKDNNAPLKMVY